MNRRSTVTALLLLCLSLAAIMPHPGAAANATPVPGVHTTRADDNILQLAAGSGYDWMVQLVEWREIEPAPGEFFWEYADWLVRAAEYYRLDLVLRLDHPPDWALASTGNSPVDVAAYSAFVSRVAERYRGRILAYIIWNEPNLALEWDGQPPDPAGYTRLLCSARSALQTADPGAVVVSAGLAPTNHTDASAMDDRLFLQEMYAAGAGECFDVLGAHPYGFAYPPQDPHNAHNGLNFARLCDLRAIMVAEGESDKPIWATELGWTTDPVGEEQQWLEVNEEEQARYLVGAFEQAAQEWPWLERIAVWHLSTGLPPGDPMEGYNILAADGTPKPACRALAEMIGNNADTGSYRQESSLPAAQPVEILAPDVVVRLSDPDTFYPHWVRPHCGAVPCRQWTGQFYIADQGVVPWRLQLEIMQVEEPGNLIWVNGQKLDPPALPLRDRPDFASVWTAIEIPVPASLLQSGINFLEIRSSPRLPVYQDGNGRFESLQFRNVRLTRGS
jgi:polysaccharide biosynthesis protein PslG